MGISKFYLVVGVILAILLSGCAPDRVESNNDLSNSQSKNGSNSESSPEPTATRRPPSTPIPTLAPTATVVPVPALEIDDQAEAIGYLFDSNYGCALPCWWGIVPGETKWQAVEDFLGPLAIEVEHQENLWYLDDGAVEHKIALEYTLQ